MGIALAESKKALPDCLPNPPVGCVLVKSGEIVARGFTRRPGSDHAEASALKEYTGSLRGVSAYVTLEPCSFQGRTPSCAVTLIEKGVAEVFVALRDPDERNNGKGIQMLVNAGISVEENVFAEDVAKFLSPYLAIENHDVVDREKFR